MAKKPQKWRLKVWCSMNAKCKFLYNFDIYCGRNLEEQVQIRLPQSEASVAHGMVTKLLLGWRTNVIE